MNPLFLLYPSPYSLKHTETSLLTKNNKTILVSGRNISFIKNIKLRYNRLQLPDYFPSQLVQ